MKLIRLAVIGVIATAVFVLAGCFPLTVPIDDPVPPVLTLPVAAFSYSALESPIQTDSLVSFNGSASYDPDGEIMWGRWDFDDDTVIEGQWTKMVSRWKNGKEVWEKESVRREVTHAYDTIGTYAVMLTVWDGEGNQSSKTRNVRVREVIP